MIPLKVNDIPLHALGDGIGVYVSHDGVGDSVYVLVDGCSSEPFRVTLLRAKLILYCMKAHPYYTQACELSCPVGFYGNDNPLPGMTADEGEYELLARKGGDAVYWDGLCFYFSNDPRRRVLKQDRLGGSAHAVTVASEWLENRITPESIVPASHVNDHWGACRDRAMYHRIAIEAEATASANVV